MSFVPYSFSSNDFKSFSNSNFQHTFNSTNNIFNNPMNGNGFQPLNQNQNYGIMNNSNQDYTNLSAPYFNMNGNHPYNIASAKSKAPLNLSQQYFGNMNALNNQGIYSQQQNIYDNQFQINNNDVSSFPSNPDQEMNALNNQIKIFPSLKNFTNTTGYVNSGGILMEPTGASMLPKDNLLTERNFQPKNYSNFIPSFPNQIQNNLSISHVSFQQQNNVIPEIYPQLFLQNYQGKNNPNLSRLRRVLSYDELLGIQNNGEKNVIGRDEEIIVNKYKENEDKFKKEIINLNQKIKVLESKYISQRTFYEKKLIELQKSKENENESPIQLRKEILFEKIKFINRLIKDYLCCPISIEPFRDPAIAPDDQTYEKKEILKWFENKHYSPITFKHLYSKVLRTNYLAKSLLSYLNQQLSSCMNELNTL